MYNLYILYTRHPAAIAVYNTATTFVYLGFLYILTKKLKSDERLSYRDSSASTTNYNFSSIVIIYIYIYIIVLVCGNHWIQLLIIAGPL